MNSTLGDPSPDNTPVRALRLLPRIDLAIVRKPGQDNQQAIVDSVQ